MIKEQLFSVEQKIQEACKKAGRNREDITLIAVSKTKPLAALQEAYDANMRHFGENKVQELCEKYEQLPNDISWHMIGHLQTNKVKYLIGKTCLIHSVDNLKLAAEIERQAAKKNCCMNILIEVNIANEETKFGVSKQDTLAFVTEISKFPHIQIKGLMAIAPYVENPEENRPFFRQMRELAVDINNQNIDNVSMEILSMGMTGDYLVAIEEGATMVRVGTGIFGERVYNL